jgi:hypothetical protein
MGRYVLPQRTFFLFLECVLCGCCSSGGKLITDRFRTEASLTLLDVLLLVAVEGKLSLLAISLPSHLDDWSPLRSSRRIGWYASLFALCSQASLKTSFVNPLNDTITYKQECEVPTLTYIYTRT